MNYHPKKHANNAAPKKRPVRHMNDYQKEQLEALSVVKTGLLRMGDAGCRALVACIAPYMAFRKIVDEFLFAHFRETCTKTCFTDQTSACCAKDSIITFFADTVINALSAPPTSLDRLARTLQQENTGHRCVYLSPDGCVWTVRPIVCAMFLCDRAMDAVFLKAPDARTHWENLRCREKGFKWPDQPVLFDHLEKVFLDLGLRSSLMHLNFSPGLLNVKRKAGLL